MAGNHHSSNKLIDSSVPSVPEVHFIMNNKHIFRKKYMDIIIKQCELNSTTGCLEWRGSRNNIYSHMSYSYRIDPFTTEKKFTSAHRMLFAVATDSLYLLQNTHSNIAVSHLCHNPLCCRLEHLEAEPTALNNSRKICKNAGQCLIHEPACIFIT